MLSIKNSYIIEKISTTKQTGYTIFTMSGLGVVQYFK